MAGKKTGPKGPSKPMDDALFKQFLNMIRIHATQDEICSVLNMSEQTLNSRVKERGYANYRDCYNQHRAEGKLSLRRMQWKTAESGNFNAQKWLGIQELGQTDKVDLGSDPDRPLQITTVERRIVKADD